MCIKKTLRFAIAILGLVWMSKPVRIRAVEALEHEIKATYLYNFAKFTEWPVGKRPAGAPLIICIFGGDPFRGSLAKLTRGKSIETHPLAVQHLSSLENVRNCDILFVSAMESKNFQKQRAALPLQSTLIVGETADFLENGGQIQFFIEESKVRFAVHLPAVEKAGLKIDARVLNIAKIRK